MRVLAVHIEKATESGVEGRKATVTMPLSEQIRKAHTGSQARSQPGGHGETVAAAEGKPGMPRQFARSHSGSRLLSLAPTVTISLSIAISTTDSHSPSLSAAWQVSTALNKICVIPAISLRSRYLFMCRALPRLRQIRIQCGRN